ATKAKNLERVPIRSGRALGLSRRLLLLRLRGLLLIERDEIDGIEQQRREAAADHRRCDELTGEREQQPRALDHDQRPDIFGRNALQVENARIAEIEREQGGGVDLRLALHLQLDLEIGV